MFSFLIAIASKNAFQSRFILLQILHTVDESGSAQPDVIEQWEMQFDGIPPTRHPRNFSYDDEPTKIYKRMVCGLPCPSTQHISFAQLTKLFFCSVSWRALYTATYVSFRPIGCIEPAATAVEPRTTCLTACCIPAPLPSFLTHLQANEWSALPLLQSRP